MATLMELQAEFNADVAWCDTQVQMMVRTPVVFIDPLPTPAPMPTPFLESAAMDLGDGFTLSQIDGGWELRRGRSSKGGIFIARFCQWSMAVKCAADLRFCFDCWDIETSFTVSERYEGTL